MGEEISWDSWNGHDEVTGNGIFMERLGMFIGTTGISRDRWTKYSGDDWRLEYSWDGWINIHGTTEGWKVHGMAGVI